MWQTKISNIEWLGTYPAHWQLKKIKYCLQERVEKNNPVKTTNILSLTAKQGVIPYDEKEGGGNKPKEDVRDYRLAYPGDIVMNSMNILSGSVGLSNYFGCVSPVYYMLRPFDKDEDVRFYNYIFQTTVFQKSLFGLGNGILIKESGNGKLNTIRMRIPMEKFGNLFIPVAGPIEQHKIANYLDQKCSEIDAITKDIQSQIETLEQYKRSVITEAVTKGLDPDVELKDSGIEWIGKISSDFRITHLKYVCLVLDGHRKPIAADKRTQNAEKLYDYYGASGVIDQIDGYTIDDDVLLIGEDGANLVLRNLPLIYQVHGKAWINNHAHILKPKNELNYYYAYYMLESLDIHIYITGSAQPKFNQLALLNMFIILPPYKKQCEIAHYLNTKCTEIDEIIAEKNKQLNILADYKKSLIFEYVTGKKEVPSA